MRGSYEHNRILIPPVEAALAERGARVWREYYVRCGAVAGYIDLLADLPGMRIACEAERTVDRIAKDISKARAVHADLLVIVTPNARVAQAARHKLRRLNIDQDRGRPAIWVLPLGPAVARLRNRCRLMTARNVPGHQSGPTRQSNPGCLGGG